MSIDLRAVMARFPTGVTVVTTPSPGFQGTTANSVTSVSLAPRWCWSAWRRGRGRSRR